MAQLYAVRTMIYGSLCLIWIHIGLIGVAADSRCFLEGGGSAESFFVSEDLPVGSIVGSLSILGDPRIAGGDITLGLRERDSPVQIAPGTRDLVLRAPLDKEGRKGPASVYVNVICDRRLSGDPSFVIPVNIRVTDANDNAPQWIGAPYTLTLSEVTVPGTRFDIRFITMYSQLPYGLVARIPGFHPGGSGSIPGEADDDMEAPVSLQYRDDHHQNSMLQALNTMRKNDRFCDVVLHVGTAAISAHRAVLASVSPHLLEMFSADQDARRDAEPVPSYRLNGGMKRRALQTLVDYAYTATLDIPDHEVKEVYLGAWQLRMERVVNECARHLVSRLTEESCIETRSLPGIAKNRDFVSRVDSYIAERFVRPADCGNGIGVSNTAAFLALNCVQIEVLHQTRQEMSMVAPGSLCRLVLDWVKRQMTDDNITVNQLMERSHLLYLAIDNSLQDCAQLPPGHDSEIVEDYKKMSQKCPTNKGRRKCLGQPVRPRVLIYSRDIGERTDADTEPDWSVIASDKVGEHTFMALVTMDGILARLSILLRLNAPPAAATPSPVATTPVVCRSPGLSDTDTPDLYCTLASMSGGKCAFGVAALNRGFVVCGGYDRVECLRTAEFYDPENNIWTPLPNMREARGRVQIAVADGRIYAIGGSNGTTELDTMEVLESGAAKWSRAPILPLARSNSGVCEMDGAIYCIGGWNGQAGIRQCDVFDPKNNAWNSIQPLTTGRYQAGVAPYNGFVYAIGGCDAWNCLSSVERYDSSEDLWSPVAPLLTSRRGCGAAVFNGKLYTIGGSDGTHTLSSTEIYDEETKTWVAGPNLTVPRANVGVVVVGERLYAIGGFSGKIFLNTIEYLDANTNEWTTFIPKAVMKFDFSSICDDDMLNIKFQHMEISNGILNGGNDNSCVYENVVANGKLSNGKKSSSSDEAGDCNGTTGANIISV